MIDELKRLARQTGQRAADAVAEYLPERPVFVGRTEDRVQSSSGVFRRHGFDLTTDPTRFGPLQSGEVAVTVPDGMQCATSEVPAISIKEVGVSGIDWQDGLPRSPEHAVDFRPVKVRGRAGTSGHGLYHEIFRTSTTFQRGWLDAVGMLTGGRWSVKPPDLPDTTPASVRDQAKQRCQVIERALLDNLHGGWSHFVRNWMYALVAGFSVFEEVYHPYGHRKQGLIDKLAFRFPSSVEHWIFDDPARELQAVEFGSVDGSSYTIPVKDLLIYSHNRIGLNYEGLPPTRPVTRWVQALHLLLQIESLGFEKYGIPIPTGKNTDGGGPMGGGDNTNVDARLETVMDKLRAEEAPVMTMPNGTDWEFKSAAGSMPDFAEAKRFCVERISEMMSSEANLIAVTDTGAYSARESAQQDKAAFGDQMGQHLADTINGASNLAHTGVIPTMEDARFGGPVREGRYCQLQYSLGETKDFTAPDRVKAINKSVQIGTLPRSPELQQEVADTLDTPGPEDVSETIPAPQRPQQSRRAAASDLRAAHGDEPFGAHSDLDVEATKTKQDRLEAELANKLEAVATQHKQRFKDEVRGARNIEMARRQAEALLDEICPQYEEVVREVLEKAHSRAAKDMIRARGQTVPRDVTIEPDKQARTKIEAQIDTIAQEAANRQSEHFLDRERERILGDSREAVPKLASSTFRAITQKSVSTSYNQGRLRVAREVQRRAKIARRTESGRSHVIAERSSVLDEDTCEPCEGLDGERARVGTDVLDSITPPLRCEGGGRCRCMLFFLMPGSKVFDQAAESLT